MTAIEASYVVGVDLGGTKILSGVVDVNGQILVHRTIPTSPDDIETKDIQLIDRLVEIIEKVIDDSGLQRSEIIGVGCSAPGLVDHCKGQVITAPNIPSWRDGYELGTELQKRLHLAVSVDNDANLGTLGEATYGAGKGISDLVGIFVGTGIGGGIFIDGNLRRGRRWLAGEVGHVTVQRNGVPCVCGLTGHVDAYAAGGPINRRLKLAADLGESAFLLGILQQNESSIFSGEAILNAIAIGDQATHRIIKDAQEVLGLLIADLVSILDPDCVVLGGGVIESLGEPFIQGIREYAYKNIFPQEFADPIKILRAKLGRYGVLLGCVALAKKDLL